MQALSEEVYKKAVVHIVQSVGVGSISADALQALTRVAVAHAGEVADTLKGLLEIPGRTHPNVDDLTECSARLGITHEDLEAYILGVESRNSVAGFVDENLQRVVRPPALETFRLPRAPWYDEVALIPSHIPSHLPHFPGKHTYKHTPVTDPYTVEAPAAVLSRKRDESRKMQEIMVNLAREHKELYPGLQALLQTVRLIPKKTTS